MSLLFGCEWLRAETQLMSQIEHSGKQHIVRINFLATKMQYIIV